MSLRAGLGRAEITVYEHGTCMLGWGQPENLALGVAMPLAARALVLEDPAGQRFVYACAELCFISQHLRSEVLARLARHGIGEHDLMLTATHTHSAPSGYSAAFFYALAGPGYSQRVVDGLVRGIVRAIEQALARLEPAQLHLHRAQVPLTTPISFNRSVAAYNCNADVEPIAESQPERATDRTLTVLRIDAESGAPRGLLCWFPVHGTCIHADNTKLHPDNKGIAARECEAWVNAGHSGNFVAIFAQEAAGDVSPNFRWSAERGLMRGVYDDDFDSAAFVGHAQAKVAHEVWREAPALGQRVYGPLQSRVRYEDFSRLTAAPEFADGEAGRTTAPACLGVGFAYGTSEGPGPAFWLRAYGRTLACLARRQTEAWREAHRPKLAFLDLGHGERGRLLSVLPSRALGLLAPLAALGPQLSYYRSVLASGVLCERSWVPQLLPLQIVRMGALVLVGVPVEPTTVAGRRMRAAVGRALTADTILINGYANSYSSYVTTHEEYELQCYEGASTLFGRWTLAAYCTQLYALARELDVRPVLSESPVRLPRAELPPSVYALA